METTITFTSIRTHLIAPFSVDQLEVKPGATNTEKTKALALAYVDSRVYQDRLDSVVGPEGWQTTYRPLPNGTGLICQLTILGIIREDVGECDPKDPNAATSAAAQAFKRCCAAFGLGRYLYHLPTAWCSYDANRKVIVNPQAVAQELYRRAGLPTTSRSA